jgi:hypothetical protein
MLSSRISSGLRREIDSSALHKLIRSRPIFPYDIRMESFLRRGNKPRSTVPVKLMPSAISGSVK